MKMKIPKKVTLWQDHPNETVINLDFRCDCISEYIVYLFICKLCPKNKSFYVGQSVQTCRDRTNGHRGRFNLNTYTKSALSCHMFKDHPENFDNKLQNYDLGIIKSTSPLDLDRCEDYYIELTKAHLSLNRYKVTRQISFSSMLSSLIYPVVSFLQILQQFLLPVSCITILELTYLETFLSVLFYGLVIFYLVFTDVFKWYVYTEELKRLHVIIAVVHNSNENICECVFITLKLKSSVAALVKSYCLY